MAMTLNELSAHEEIRQAIYRHFRAADRLDVELDRTASWDDGVFEGGPFEGQIGENIPRAFIDMAKLWTVTNHYMTNILIELRGNHAFVEIYAITYHLAPPGSLEAVLGAAKLAKIDPLESHEVVIGIRYSVRMEQRRNVWKIAVMKLVVDWSRVSPYTGFNEGGIMDSLKLRGSRGRNDPSYPWHP